jgi:DNA mismatch repair protein MutS2
MDALLEARALTVVTTHMGMLKTYGFTRRGVQNACVTFDPDTLAPTFRLLVGQPGNSNALIIARRYGIPAEVVRRAEGLVAEADRGTQDLLQELVSSGVEMEQSRIRAEEMVQETRRKLADADRQLSEAESARERVESEAESEVARILEEFAAAARPHLNALKNVPKALKDDACALEELLEHRLRMTPFAARRRELLRELKKNDHVYVPRFERVCRVEKLNRKDERLTVKVGDVSMEIAFDDVSWLRPPGA